MHSMNNRSGVKILDENLVRGKDLAKKYKASPSQSGLVVTKAVTDRDMAAIDENGFVIIEDLLSPDELKTIREEALGLVSHKGRNTFEGVTTQRLYAVLEKTRAFDRLIDHPRILAILDRLFEPNYLLSQCQVINILPGEAAQALHPDDFFYPMPKPRPELGAATVWAIDDFTQANGATVVVPKSHKWPNGRMPDEHDVIQPAVMRAGSVVFYPGSLWHGGGANRSAGARMGITCQYCQPYLRPQENYCLSTSKEVVKAVSEDIRRMLGYSVHPPFMGMVNGMHPKRLLED